MADSTGSSGDRKPRPTFPLWIHKGNKSTPARWAKRVKGKRTYFGSVADDPEGKEALRAWQDLLAGRTAPAISGGEGLAIKDLLNRFLTAKENAKKVDKITARTWSEYKLTTDRIVAVFGRTKLVKELTTADFERLLATFSETRGPEATGNEVQRTRAIFKYAYDNGLIEQPMRFGSEFKRPSKKIMRKVRAAAGPKMFEAADARKLLARAGLQLKTMILLALNCGFGNNDCAKLEISAVDLINGWIAFPRPKTGIDRRCPLWPETIKRLKAVIASRKAPKDPEHAGLLFITKYGGTWAKETADNPVSKEFAKLVKEAKLSQRGRGFYSLRHTFRTVADSCRDFPAIDLIMGHSDASMAARYRERIDDTRLLAVATHVRAWLFPKATKATPEQPDEPEHKPEPARKAKATKSRRSDVGATYDDGPVVLKLFRVG